jgi:thioredoxin-related protein
MRMCKFFIVVILSVHSLMCLGQIEHDAEEAFRIASETQKPVLLVFAGSDWCAPCIRFDKQVLSENEFLEFAKENLVILKADFPQRKQVAAKEQKQNDLLAEAYNPKGIFPQLILLRADKTVLAPLPYSNQSSEEFISQLKDTLSK